MPSLAAPFSRMKKTSTVFSALIACIVTKSGSPAPMPMMSIRFMPVGPLPRPGRQSFPVNVPCPSGDPVRKPPDRQGECPLDARPHQGALQLATLRRQIALDAGPAAVWSAVRDFGAVHTRVAPGFLTRLEIDKGDRVVTFFNGLVARERLVTLDDEDCRLVYTVVEGRPSHYNAAVQVFP